MYTLSIVGTNKSFMYIIMLLINSDLYFNTDEMKECEWMIEMINELSVGVNGFNEPEIADILSFISTM